MEREEDLRRGKKNILKLSIKGHQRLQSVCVILCKTKREPRWLIQGREQKCEWWEREYSSQWP